MLCKRCHHFKLQEEFENPAESGVVLRCCTWCRVGKGQRTSARYKYKSFLKDADAVVNDDGQCDVRGCTREIFNSKLRVCEDHFNGLPIPCGAQTWKVCRNGPHYKLSTEFLTAESSVCNTCKVAPEGTRTRLKDQGHNNFIGLPFVYTEVTKKCHIKKCGYTRYCGGFYQMCRAHYGGKTVVYKGQAWKLCLKCYSYKQLDEYAPTSKWCMTCKQKWSAVVCSRNSRKTDAASTADANDDDTFHHFNPDDWSLEDLLLTVT